MTIKTKPYNDIFEWYHPEIEYSEMIDNFRWTKDKLQEAIGRQYTFPLDHVTLMFHARAWEEEGTNMVPGDQQMFQYWNKQLNDELAVILKKLAPKTILDVCAGDGTLAKMLSDRGFNVIAVDNYSWPFRNRVFKIRKMDYKKALAKYQPDVVIGCWMPLGSDWTKDFRKTRSVRHYIQIGEVNACCGGDWEDRKTWPIFRCDKASEYALCRTDDMWFSGGRLDHDFMMHHSAVYLTSRRKFALTNGEIS